MWNVTVIFRRWRLLRSNSSIALQKTRTIGVGYSNAKLPTIRPQAHDIRMDVIVTETGVMIRSQPATSCGGTVEAQTGCATRSRPWVRNGRTDKKSVLKTPHSEEPLPSTRGTARWNIDSLEKILRCECGLESEPDAHRLES
jgi:hypothetical protein